MPAAEAGASLDRVASPRLTNSFWELGRLITAFLKEKYFPILASYYIFAVQLPLLRCVSFLIS